MSEVKQCIVIRRDLKMGKGKCVSQGAHASMACLLNNMFADDKKVQLSKATLKYLYGADVADAFMNYVNGTCRFTKVCVYVNSEQELLDIYEKAKAAKLPCSLIKDAGLTEFHGVPTLTCCGIGPAPAETIDLITGELPLL